MPKDNYDSGIHLVLVAHAKLLRIPFESNGGLCSINSFEISSCCQASAGSTDPWHHSTILNQESFTWSHTKV